MSTPDLTPAPAKVRTIYKADLEKREELLEQKRRLGREADAIGKQVEALDDEISRWVLDQAPKERTVNRSGFRLSILAKRKGVSWSGEFLKRFGVTEKKKLEERQPFVDKLQIEKL